MKIGRVVLLLATLLYIASFFLVAVGVPDRLRGYDCAYTALVFPWSSDGLKSLRDGPIDYFSILLSGLINPVFIVTLILLWRKPRGRTRTVLRIVLVLMFGACWVVFYRMHVQPRAGYLLWTGAMLVALFSGLLISQSPGKESAK
jgi:hypothetical protein